MGAQSSTDINIEDDNQWTPLLLAAHERLWSMVECLVGWGSVLNVTDVNGDTPLHFVVSSTESSPVQSTHLKEVYVNRCMSARYIITTLFHCMYNMAMV